jgi:hypothetical protein
MKSASESLSQPSLQEPLHGASNRLLKVGQRIREATDVELLPAVIIAVAVTRIEATHLDRKEREETAENALLENDPAVIAEAIAMIEATVEHLEAVMIAAETTEVAGAIATTNKTLHRDEPSEWIHPSRSLPSPTQCSRARNLSDPFRI